ncbi:nucleoporin p58/p45-like isoform X2 [Saccostrea echinata]|uniref:nucleoporin p58/p45-like isoform X2 n=1 Tax=Saccostrea echinata TaxID=191078 RepID=UPI002A82C735|nr:nucleoporin p58/p45-like isoform X2 [Saccostrea echinata]
MANIRILRVVPCTHDHSIMTTSCGFTFGTPSTQASQNVTFGGTGQTPATSGTTPFNFGSTPSSTGGFKLGGTTPAFPSTKTTTPSTAGFTLGGATTQPAGFKLGAAATSTPAFPGSTTTASTAPTVGFALPIPSTSAGLGGGLTGGIRPTLTSTSSTAGGFPSFSNPSLTKPTGLLGATTATGSIFGTPATTSQTVGLGGVDPKTSTATSGGLTVDPKAGDGKTLKKSQIPPEIMKTVEDFKTYVKEEKTEQEGISRMSSKPMYKVQQDVASLKQLLSIVSNGLQRNACAVEKLKREMTQELKNAEMAQRTKDIPAGLQYENTAPTEYFQQLVEDFETQMLTYRQQIETLEGHLHSISQPSILSPEELIDLLRKLHEAFIALAAQLHQVHEAVKTQKEHYLNYRKIFLHDTKNIFEREKKPVKAKVVVDHFGPSPFSGLSNAAAVAMASALTKSQQPASAPPVARLGALGQTTGGFGSTGLFGATTTTAPTFGFGLGATTTTAGFGGFGSTTTTTTTSSGFSFTGLNTATVRPLGFGTPTTTTPSLFGTPQTGQTTPAFGSPQLFPSGGGEQPFQLNKPPGTKRNKR